MALRKEPFSKQARLLTHELSSLVHPELRRERGITKKLREAVAAIVADLIPIPVDPSRASYAYRSVRAASFTDSPIKRKPFRDAIRAMEALDLVTVKVGFKPVTGSNETSQATRFFPTPKLVALVGAHGIDAGNLADHFKNRKAPAALQRPVELRLGTRKAFGSFGTRIRGDAVRLGGHPKAAAYGDQVNRFNAFLSEQIIEGCEFFGIRRVFNEADRGGHDMNKGGRLYAVEPSYQSMPKAERASIRLNGEPVVEVDVKCSQLNILRKLCGDAFDPSVDAYSSVEFPRDIVKRFVTQTLGGQRLGVRWSGDQTSSYLARMLESDPGYTGTLQKDFPFSEVKAAVLVAIPALARWNSLSIRWGELQFRESEAVVAAMDQLISSGVPALPVHDSLIVPASKAELAKEALRSMYKRYIGFEPLVV